MRYQISKYLFAAGLTATVVGAAFGGPGFVCGLYGYCGGGHTAHAFLLALALGALGGVVGMALIDIAVKARFAMVNRELAKQPHPGRPPRDGEQSA